MSDTKHLNVVIRVRKSGSQSLIEMLKAALPDSMNYAMPHDPPVADLGTGFAERFRLNRRVKKRLWKLFKTTSYTEAWRKVNSLATSGDLVSGHFCHDSVVLPDWELRFITLVREPLERLYSEYRYCRQSYRARPFWRRAYLSQRLKVAGRGTFGDYIDYLSSFGDRFANPLIGYLCGDLSGDLSPYEFLKAHYFHYGTLEDIEHFAEGLSAKLGREVPKIWTNKTSDPGGLKVENYDPKKLRELIGRDQDLYQSIINEAQVGSELNLS